MELLRFAYVNPTPTPIYDRLLEVTGGNRLATFHGQPGGEWDVLRATPLRRRQRLTTAGWLARDGVKPDFFVDLLRRYGAGVIEGDPIEWYLREAHRATSERKAAAVADARRRLAKRAGLPSYYAYRTALARELGYPSLWVYRRAMGWT